MTMQKLPALVVLVCAAPLLSGCIGAGASGEAGADGAGPSLAQAMMWSASYPSLIVEVDAGPGVAPPTAHLDELRATLQELTGRTQVIVYGPTYTRAPEMRDGLGDLATIHRRTADVGPDGRDVHTDGATAVLHVVYLDGRMEDAAHAKTAGVTLYEHGAIFLFPDTYAHLMQVERGELVPAADDVGRVVLMHEVGHALGLLDRGAPMLTPREDPEHPGHSVEVQSFMSSGHAAHNGIIQGDLEKVFTMADRIDLAGLRGDDPALD